MKSAIMRAEAGFDGFEPFDTLQLKAAAVCCGLIANHGFVDGNKRIGIAALCLILRKNDLSIGYIQSEWSPLALPSRAVRWMSAPLPNGSRNISRCPDSHR